MNYSTNFTPCPTFNYSDHRSQNPGSDNFFRQSHWPQYYRAALPPTYVGPTYESQYFPPHYSELLSGCSHYLQDHTSSPIHRNSSTQSRFKVSDRRRTRRPPYSRRTTGNDSVQIRGRSDSRSARGILTVRKAYPRTTRTTHFHKQMDSPATNYRNTPKQSPIQLSVGRNRDNDMCFKCKEKGHWAINCPGKSPENSRVLPLKVPVFDGEDGLQYSAPYLICWCGLLCALKSSKGEKNPNPNRKYYRCFVMDKSHTFKWEDTVKEDELLSVPKCRCGAGFCRLYTEASGTNPGLKYFACPIKKGQGACTFKKLLNGEVLTGDELGDERISSLRSTLGDDGDICLENITRDGISGHKEKGLEIGSISGELHRVALVRPAVLRFPKELEESEQELKVALEAAEEASKVLQQKNEEYYVAEAAYKKARVELHQFAMSDE